MHRESDAINAASGGVQNLQARELAWPRETRLVYTARGRVNKRNQGTVMTTIFDELIKRFVTDFSFVAGVHLASMRINHHKTILISVATDLGYVNVVNCAQQDLRFTLKLLDVVSSMLTMYQPILVC